jgi:hypothetical protein
VPIQSGLDACPLSEQLRAGNLRRLVTLGVTLYPPEDLRSGGCRPDLRLNLSFAAGRNPLLPTKRVMEVLTVVILVKVQ